MRAAYLAALLATAAAAQKSDPRFWRFTTRTDQGRTDRGLLAGQLAFLEFAPLNGAGMTATCGCTNPTGGRGEAFSLTRATNATCSKKGVATTGINNGDLVVCANNQARIEPDPSGLLGFRVEAARTNSLVQSQALDVAPWADLTENAAAAPTLNGANAGVAPDGTTTAEDYSFPATAATQTSSRAINAGCTSVSPHSSGIYVKGVTGTGTIDLCHTVNSAPLTVSCTACAYTNASWTWCQQQNATYTSGGTWFVGNVTNYNGGTTRPLNRVLLWQADCQSGAYMTSPIPTTSAAATRNAESGVSLTLSTGTWPAGSAAMTWTPLATAGSAGQLTFSTNGRALYGVSPNILAFDGTNNPSTPAGVTAGAAKRYWSSWSTAGGWVVRNATDGNQSTSAFTAGTWSPDSSLELTTAFLGTPDGIYSRVCLDPDTTRCR